MAVSDINVRDMTDPIIFHQADVATSGRKMIRALCVGALLWFVF
jgi:hypothetical protein